MYLAEKQISLLQYKKEKLLDIFLEGQITEEEYQKKKKTLEKDISDLAGRLKPKISPMIVINNFLRKADAEKGDLNLMNSEKSNICFNS